MPERKGLKQGFECKKVHIRVKLIFSLNKEIYMSKYCNLSSSKKWVRMSTKFWTFSATKIR